MRAPSARPHPEFCQDRISYPPNALGSDTQPASGIIPAALDQLAHIKPLQIIINDPPGPDCNTIHVGPGAPLWACCWATVRVMDDNGLAGFWLASAISAGVKSRSPKQVERQRVGIPTAPVRVIPAGSVA